MKKTETLSISVEKGNILKSVISKTREMYQMAILHTRYFLAIKSPFPHAK